jgi:hypothetical protein
MHSKVLGSLLVPSCAANVLELSSLPLSALWREALERATDRHQQSADSAALKCVWEPQLRLPPVRLSMRFFQQTVLRGSCEARPASLVAAVAVTKRRCNQCDALVICE